MKPVPRLSTSVRCVAPKRRVQPSYGWRWQQLRKIKRASEPSCEVCGRPAQEVHHKKPIADGGDPYDMANLMSICTACHDDQHGGTRWRNVL